eukprot:2469654-Rhodomonas_salina.1
METKKKALTFARRQRVHADDVHARTTSQHHARSLIQGRALPDAAGGGHRATAGGEQAQRGPRRGLHAIGDAAATGGGR